MHATDEAPDPALEQRILSKVMWRVMPIFILGYLISFIDRANLGVLAAPISRDLHLTGASFGFAAGLFYIGYLAFAIPSNMAIVKFGGRVWMTIIMSAWGIVCFALATTENATALNAYRMLLGVAEAGFYPGALFLMTLWFPPRSLGKAYSIYTAYTPLGLVFGALATSALLALDGFGPIADWRLVFVLEGIPAFALAAYTFLRLPDRPQDATWLTPEEKSYLSTQIPAAKAAVRGDVVRNFLGVLKSGAAWVFAALYFLMLLGYWGLVYFMPKILQERFHTDAVHSGFISAIPWLFACALIWGMGRTSVMTGDRRWHMFFGMVLSGAGLYLAAVTDSPTLTLIGLCLGAGGTPAAAAFFWTMPATMFAGAAVAITVAMVNSVGNLSGLAGPWVIGFLTDLTGNSRSALYSLAATCIVAAVLAFVMGTIMLRREQQARSNSSTHKDALGNAGLGTA
ncbi:MAG: major Facilitator Superfamily protein [Variovorax sp.]|nr:major Facilitator Superfamily protein [Variovorax sp.]